MVVVHMVWDGFEEWSCYLVDINDNMVVNGCSTYGMRCVW
jgi:hypothetical protein